MDMQCLQAIVRELNTASVRYIVAGGLAVAAHGYLRFTADLDLVIQLDAANIVQAFDALGRLGYRPSVPVTAQQFADPSQRKRWIEERRMQVLNFFSDRFRTMPVDVFVNEPFAFQDEFDAAIVEEIAPGLSVRFVSIETLISMKRSAGRAKDLDDIEHLQIVLQEIKRS